jgi:hypothetical protein
VIWLLVVWRINHFRIAVNSWINQILYKKFFSDLVIYCKESRRGNETILCLNYLIDWSWRLWSINRIISTHKPDLIFKPIILVKFMLLFYRTIRIVLFFCKFTLLKQINLTNFKTKQIKKIFLLLSHWYLLGLYGKYWRVKEAAVVVEKTKTRTSNRKYWDLVAMQFG